MGGRKTVRSHHTLAEFVRTSCLPFSILEVAQRKTAARCGGPGDLLDICFLLFSPFSPHQVFQETNELNVIGLLFTNAELSFQLWLMFTGIQ